ncbi:asparagine synthase [Candidatus Woesearchaeota archaeon]|nr:asparagine synthase [Candidatus Woesearchaeota archaeon]
METYARDGLLISEKEWRIFVAKLCEDVEENLDLTLLKEKIESAVLARAKIAGENIGLFFSGGVDSTLIGWILKKNNIPFTAYTVGFQDEGTKMPEDVEESLTAAKELGFKQKIIMLNLEEADEVFKECAKILKDDTNVVSLGVGGVVFSAARAAKKDRVTHFFGGLGSEELFAGYQRHEAANTTPDALQKECRDGLANMWARDFKRDCALAESLGIILHTPFLDEELIKVAMAIPASEKIKERKNEKGEVELVKKHCLRIVAEELGLTASFAWRPKRAAQYGSRLDSALDKLAKNEKLSSKSEYIIQILA